MGLWRKLVGDRATTPPRRRLARLALVFLGIFLVLLLIGRLAAPPLIEKVVEKSLENMPGGYRGTIDHIDMRMLSAEIALVGMQIEKKNGLVPVPFMKVGELVLGTVRDGLKPRTTLRFVQPVINYVDAESEAKKQTGPTVDLAQIRKQLPFELINVQIEDGEFHFRNFEAKPPVDVYMQHLAVNWDKLVGCMPPGNASCRSELAAEAAIMTTGKLDVKGKFERTPEVHFDARVTVDGLKAPRLNTLLKHYAKVDVKKGEIALEVTYKRRGERQDALIIPGLADFEVVGDDDKDTRFFRELGVAAAAGYFERKRGKKAISMSATGKKKPEFSLVDLRD